MAGETRWRIHDGEGVLCWPLPIQRRLWRSRLYGRFMRVLSRRAWYVYRFFDKETEMADWTWQRAHGARLNGNGQIARYSNGG